MHRKLHYEKFPVDPKAMHQTIHQKSEEKDGTVEFHKCLNEKAYPSIYEINRLELQGVQLDVFAKMAKQKMTRKSGRV